MPPTRLHLLRHAQGRHQLEPTALNQNLPDPPLTDEGIAQSKSFSKNFPKSIRLNLICASPLRRCIQTAQHCFADQLSSSSSSSSTSQSILLLPDAQEATDLPSDTGSDRAVIEAEFGALVDARFVEKGWNCNEGVYAPTAQALAERAKRLRVWLSEREEGEVAVVGHGNFWHWLTGEVDGKGRQTTPYWDNTEWRSYSFEFSEKDGEVRLVEEEESIARRRGVASG